MHKHYRLLVLLICTFGTAFSQTPHPAQDYKVLFKSGAFEPSTQNASRQAIFNQWSTGNTWYGAIQFNQLPTDAQRKELLAMGIRTIGYIPNNTYLAVVNRIQDTARLNEMGVRAVFELTGAQKTEGMLWNGTYPTWAEVSNNRVDVSVELFEGLNESELKQSLGSLPYELLSTEPIFNRITLRIFKTDLKKLAAVPVVLWIEPITPPVKDENLPGKTLHRSNVLNDGIRGLTGNTIKIGIWDGGAVGPHLDFAGRLTVVEPGVSSEHGTHVAGTMAGSGALNPYARGMAPKATIFGYDYNGSVNSEIASSILADQIVISQHSYGFGDAFVNCTSKDPYNTNSREQDVNIYNNPYFFHAHSAGNSQAVCTGGWGTTTGKAAKNVLVVGNVSATEAINSSSSFGPVQDGRIKPEISADGVDVFSTLPNNSYVGGYTGTSMATPVVSGVAAQLYERYVQLTGVNPNASLLKAVMCNTAKDIGNAGPDYKHGFGVLNGLRAVKTLEAANYSVGSLSTSGTATISVTVPAGATRIKVMLCWTDYPALAASSPALVNDLDLSLIDPSSVTFNPWVLSAASPNNLATRAADHLNNIEQVTIDNPASGTYTIQISGFSVPQGPQEYAVTWVVEEPHLELTYPNGGEKLVPGSTQTIHWDQAGITGIKTLQYSINGGSTWTNISTSVVATASWYSWTVPAIGGNRVLVRVTNGTYTDQSDASFNVLGVNGGLTLLPGCVAGQVRATWSAVTGATHYAIVKMDETNGNWDTVVTDIVGTSANLTGLTEGSYGWFAMVAKNNTNYSIGERSIAQNLLVPAYSDDLSIVGVTASKSPVCEGDNLELILEATQSRSLLSGYKFLTTTGNSLMSMTGATTLLSSNIDDDPTVTPANIGFTFNVGGQDYEKFSVSPDGWILLGNTTATVEYANAVASTSNAPKIYPYWDDVATGTTGNVKTLLVGTAPNRVLVVQWFVTIPRNTTGAANSTYQALLYESTNTIEFRYGTMGSTTAATASSGITLSGSNFRSVVFSSNTESATVASNSNLTPPTSGRMYSFTVPPVNNIVWSPATYLDTLGGAQVTAINVGATTTYDLTVTSASGCSETFQYTMLVNPRPRVGFTINHPLQAINNQSFVFTDTTSGSGNTRDWTLGDGNTAFINPVTKTYASTGQYNVKLKETTPGGCVDSIQKTVRVLSAAPTVSATSLSFTNNATTSVQINWVNGGGSRRVVLMKAASAVSTTLKPGTALTASAVFGSGALQSDSSYVVYAGTGNTVTVTGLVAGQTYYVAVVELNVDGSYWVYQSPAYLTGMNTNLPLPVTWLGILARQLSANEVEVFWETAAEKNNSHFEVMRSTDGNNWTMAGRVQGAGNSNLVTKYRFVDILNTPLSQRYYYKIKQVDYDGMFKYSPSVSVMLSEEKNAAVSVYPNPVKTQFAVSHGFGANTTLELLKADGLSARVIQDYTSGNSIDVNHLPAGLYLLRLSGGGKVLYTTKVYISE